jgi:type II secretory pathway component PulF
VPVFKYRAMDSNTEGYEEAGRVVAQDKGDAERKLKQHGLKPVSLKKMQGMAAFLGRLTAEIK